VRNLSAADWADLIGGDSSHGRRISGKSDELHFISPPPRIRMNDRPDISWLKTVFHQGRHKNYSVVLSNHFSEAIITDTQ
jgi:hypothetical protein